VEKHKVGIANWFVLFLLGGIWGSSFILMKIASRSLGPLEISALRMSFAGIFILYPFYKLIIKIRFKLYLWIVVAALFGSGVPSILFALSSSKIDSNINGVINSLTPIFTLVVSIIWLRQKTSTLSILSLFIGLSGVLLLIFQRNMSAGNIQYALLPLIATAMYGVNINLVKEKLSALPSMDILAGVFGTMILIALPYLIYKGTFLPFSFYHLQVNFWTISENYTQQYTNAIVATFILGTLGSAFSSFIFYYLLKRTNALFSSMNTYLIPLMSIFWGYLDGEAIGWIHFVSLLIILGGVWGVSKRG
jgi:drug/metabolite transporter (DMT)-like permease